MVIASKESDQSELIILDILTLVDNICFENMGFINLLTTKPQIGLTQISFFDQHFHIIKFFSHRITSISNFFSFSYLEGDAYTFCENSCHIPADIWRKNDGVLTSMRRDSSTSIRRHFGTNCPMD